MSAQQKTCFVISPIGPEGSDIRTAANDFLELLVEPALEKYGFLVTRADRIARPTAITSDIVKLVQESDLCLMDLTHNNPNVFYECGRRHETGKPFLQLVKKGMEGSLPFDVAGIRTIPYDVSSPRAARESVLKLQEFIDALVASGFETATTGDSLASIAQGIERIERKVTQLLSIPQGGHVISTDDDEELELTDLIKSPRDAYVNALRKGKLDQALAMLDKLKKIMSPPEYATALAIPASMGHGKSFERLDSELNALLRQSDDVKDEVLQPMIEGVKKYFENTGDVKSGLKYVTELYATALPLPMINDRIKAFIANKVGMLAWDARDFALCIKWTRVAISHFPSEPAYHYNLALVFEQEEQADELHTTLKALNQLADLDTDHRRLLRKHGYTPGAR